MVDTSCYFVTGIRTCFECKKTSDDMVQCSMPSCGRYYHSECLSQVGVTVRKDSGRIICRQHNCATCVTRMPVKSAAKTAKGMISFLCCLCLSCSTKVQSMLKLLILMSNFKFVSTG